MCACLLCILLLDLVAPFAKLLKFSQLLLLPLFTGGGPPKRPDYDTDPQEGIILDLLGATATGLEAEFDCDHIEGMENP